MKERDDPVCVGFSLLILTVHMEWLVVSDYHVMHIAA